MLRVTARRAAQKAAEDSEMSFQIDSEMLERDGYVVVENLLDEKQLTALKREAATLRAGAPERVAWNEHPCFRHTAFRGLLKSAPLIEIARRCVGDDVQLLQFDLLRVPSGSIEEYWHRDVERVFDETVCLSCAIYLQDTPSDAGALLVVPGSHRWKALPTVGCDGFRDKAISIPVKAGMAIVHDSGLWHSASANAGNADCWALFPIFGPYWIKRRDQNSPSRLPADLLHSDDPQIRQLFGIGLRRGAPTYLGDSEVYNMRGDEGVDYISQ
jgi:ectoine hydroxylase-related dioxygenase (phytanoyl-CoA dioxygenase family)